VVQNKFHSEALLVVWRNWELGIGAALELLSNQKERSALGFSITY